MSDTKKLDHRIATAEGMYQSELRRREVAENATVLALQRALAAEEKLRQGDQRGDAAVFALARVRNWAQSWCPPTIFQQFDAIVENAGGATE